MRNGLNGELSDKMFLMGEVGVEATESKINLISFEFSFEGIFLSKFLHGCGLALNDLIRVHRTNNYIFEGRIKKILIKMFSARSHIWIQQRFPPIRKGIEHTSHKTCSWILCRFLPSGSPFGCSLHSMRTFFYFLSSRRKNLNRSGEGRQYFLCGFWGCWRPSRT